MVALASPEVGGERVVCSVQIRYDMPTSPRRIARVAEDRVAVRFVEPLRAVAPGQAPVFYGAGERAGSVLEGYTLMAKL